jgi:hypothetical protein
MTDQIKKKKGATNNQQNSPDEETLMQVSLNYMLTIFLEWEHHLLPKQVSCKPIGVQKWWTVGFEAGESSQGLGNKPMVLGFCKLHLFLAKSNLLLVITLY